MSPLRPSARLSVRVGERHRLLQLLGQALVHRAGQAAVMPGDGDGLWRARLQVLDASAHLFGLHDLLNEHQAMDDLADRSSLAGEDDAGMLSALRG